MSTLGAIVKKGYEEELGRQITEDELMLIISKRTRPGNKNKPVAEILREGW